MKLRIDKYLADMGTGTRSEVREYIKKGLVSVNGSTVRDNAAKVDTDDDVILYNGESVGYDIYQYYMINKPSGVVSATEDRKCRTVVDLIDCRRKDIFPVGRLDRDTEGLLLITNDGELAHKLLSPKNHVDKKYFVRVRGRLTDEHIKLMASGFRVDDELEALPAVLEILRFDENTTEAFITIHEGKFHQIKRMMAAVGCDVIYLKRLSMGNLVLPDSLEPGQYRKLTDEEINKLKEL